MSDFQAVCEGAAVSKARAYDKTAAKHTAISYETGAYGWSDNSATVLPSDWQMNYTAQGANYQDVDLVVCAKRTADKQVKVCDGYKSDGKETGNKVRWHTATYQLTVREAKTARQLADQSVEATNGECPMIVNFTEKNQTKDDYASLPKEAVIGILKPFVQS